MTDALASCKQTVSELDRFKVQVALDILEPLRAVSCSAL